MPKITRLNDRFTNLTMYNIENIDTEVDNKIILDSFAALPREYKIVLSVGLYLQVKKWMKFILY